VTFDLPTEGSLTTKLKGMVRIRFDQCPVSRSTRQELDKRCIRDSTWHAIK